MFDLETFMDNRGRYKTRSLFKEVCRPEDEPLLSWSKDTDNGCVNIRELFIKLTVDDPSEALFAETLCGDIGWWEEVKKSTWIRQQYESWKKIAAIKRKAKAFKAIIKEVEENGRSSFTAAKYLIEEPWTDKRTRKQKELSDKTTEEAFQSIGGDIARLKEHGFLNG